MSIPDTAVERAYDFLARKNYDAMLITSRENNRYFSGFTGSDSTLLITARDGENFLFTDGRYTEQARLQCPGWKIVEYKRVTEAVAKRVKDLGITKLAFESRALSYNLYHRYIEALESSVLVPQEKAIDLMRMKKTPQEVKAIEGAIAMAEGALENSIKELKPGVKENEFAVELEYKIRRAGSLPIPFEIIVASGHRGALPHGVASDKVIKKNELVTIDFGANNAGYMCDTTVTFGLGSPSEELREIYQTVKDAHDSAIEGLKPGMALKDIDALARKYIERKNYGKYFSHGLGHGVGLAVHEEPTLSYLADGELEEDSVVTIEPGIYIPEKGGVRIESMALVTANGANVLTKWPKKLTLL